MMATEHPPHQDHPDRFPDQDFDCDFGCDFDHDDQAQYDRLINALELSLGQLEILLAVCDDVHQQARIIEQYSTELRGQSIQHYYAHIPHQEPSLKAALDRLERHYPDLNPHTSVVTVLGADKLLLVKMEQDSSERQQFYGYLQWRREALRSLSFPLVLWMPYQVYREMVDHAPDFWSWRGGVFWFGTEQVREALGRNPVPVALSSPVITDPQLQALLQRIETASQTPNSPDLADLFQELGNLYDRRTENAYSRQFALQAFKQAVQLYRQQGDKPALAKSLERLGDLCRELRHDLSTALDSYTEALALYREVGSRLGEANTLKAIGDVLQFLDRREEALSHYQQALALFREVGSRLGEANTLLGIGRLQAELTQALAYFEQAQGLYVQIQDQYSQGRNLCLYIAPTQAQLGQRERAIESYQRAAHIGEAINVLPLRDYALEQLQELQDKLQE